MGLISILTENKNQITKEILNKNLDKTTTGHIVNGEGQAQNVTPAQLQNVIESISSNSCLCLGVVADEGLDTYDIGPSKKIQRTQKHFSYPTGLPGWLLLDFDFGDQNHMTPEEAIQIVSKYDPRLSDCNKVVSYSASSFLYDSETGKKINKFDNFHIYIEMEDGANIPDYGQYLFDSLILDGHGSILVVKSSGAMRVKTLIDRAVFTSGQNREIFEADPICCEGVESRRRGTTLIDDGGRISWDPDMELSPEDKIRLELIISDLKRDPQTVAESELQNKKGRIKRLQAKKSKGTGKTLVSYSDWMDSAGTTHSVLGMSEVIKCNAGTDIQILDIVKDIANWKDKGIPNPIDPWVRGIKNKKVGKDIARVRFNEDTGRAYIFSFHGSVEYDLVWDFDSVSKRIEDATTDQDIDDILDDVFTETSTANTILTEGEMDDLAIEFANKNKELGVTKSPIGTDARKAPKKLKSLAEKGGQGPTSAAASGGGAANAAPVVAGGAPQFVTKLNSKMGMAMLGGKARVIEEEFSPSMGEWNTKFTSIHELKDFHANKRVYVKKNGETVQMPEITAWHEHEARNTYDRVVFKPSNDVFRGCGQVPVIKQGGEYNQWMGFLANLNNATKCDKILWHIKNVWCSGGEEIYDYTINWLATLFQSPEKVGQPYLILKSKQGAGKNIIIDQVICRILGCHAITTENKDDIIGRFNSHLEVNVFTFLDEAVFAGDPRSKNLMKSFVNTYRIVERKGIDKTKGKNLTKIMMATNEEHAANIEIGDRRHVYLPVSDEKKGDADYFEELIMEIENGGREAFLDYMLKFKIKRDLNVLPEGQSDQREKDQARSAPAPVKFINDLFENGPDAYYEIDNGVEDYFEGWYASDVRMPKHVLLSMFNSYCRSSNIRVQHMDTQAFFAELSSHGIYVNRKGEREVRYDAMMTEVGRERELKIRARQNFYDLEEGEDE